MHEHIRRFKQEGEVRDSGDFVRLRDIYRNMLEDEMRSQGYVPQLDCGEHFSPEFDESNKRFSFKMTMYGVFVGKKRACDGAVAYYDGRVHDC